MPTASRANTPSPAQTVSVQNAIAIPFLRGQSATRSSARKQTSLTPLCAAQCAFYARASGTGEPLHDVRCGIEHEGVLRLGASPRMRPVANSPPARECGCRKLLFCPGTAQKTEASRAHRPLARSLKLPRVAQDRRERMTTPYAALAPQYNKSQEGQLSQLYFNGLWQIQPRATSPLMEYGEFDRTDQPVDGLQQAQPRRPVL